MILTSGLSVYNAAMESGNYEFSALVAESGLLCPDCGTAYCAKYHGQWLRKKIRDLCSGDVFQNLPLLRVRFCSKSTKTIYPAELWRGRGTVTSVLETVFHVIDDGIELALQRVMDAGDGTETVSERSVRRWVKRVGNRLPVAARVLAIVSERVFSDTAAMFEHFLTHLYPHHLLQLRRQWGYSVLDVVSPDPVELPHTTNYPKPVFQNPRPPHDPPAKYLPRGTRSWLIHRE
jgi:hypothetical protein